MKISVVGSGYVGTTVAACFAASGHEVVAIDTDVEVVTAINDGIAPIHDPGLDELVAEYGGEELRASTEYSDIQDTVVTFVALPTPSQPDGRIDTSVIEGGVRSLGDAIAGVPRGHCVVIKSTVIPGTTDETLIPLLEEPGNGTEGNEFDVAVNPEFLREGSAVRDFQNPDKIVVGADRPRVFDLLREVYAPFLDSESVRMIETGRREAEFIKYANNAFLAAKVSLINEIGNIAKAYDVDAYEVAEALGADHRISGQFLRSGVGWGGSCWPKDVDALIAAAYDRDYTPRLLEAVVDVNREQPDRLLRLLDSHVDVTGQRVAVLGLSFKPGTDDIRNSQAIPVIEGLRERGAMVVGYDPVAMEGMRNEFPDIEYADTAAEALTGAVAVVVVTEWDEFAALDAEFDQMANPVVVDGRRVVTRRDGLEYEGITW